MKEIYLLMLISGLTGGFGYNGKELYDHTASGGPLYKSKIRRYGVDLSYKVESFPHNIDAVAVYMQGKDKNVWDGVGSNFDIKFKGFYGEASYFYNRTYGLTLGYDYLKSKDDSSLDKKGPTINVSYLPWANTKLALEYSHFELTGGQKQDVYNLLVHLYF